MFLETPISKDKVSELIKKLERNMDNIVGA